MLRLGIIAVAVLTSQLAHQLSPVSPVQTKEKPPIVIDGDKRFDVKHRYQAITKSGWTVEAWLWGSRHPIHYPIDVAIRAHSPKKDARLPKIRVAVGLFKEGIKKANKEFDGELNLKECLMMKDGEEVTYDGKRNWGKSTPFPKLPGYWQTNVTDPFKSDRRRDGSTPLEAGEFLLKINVELEKTDSFAFEAMAVTLYKGRD